MADILKWVEREFQKRYRDMLDGSHAEVVAIGGLGTVDANLQVNNADNAVGNPAFAQLTAGEAHIGEVGGKSGPIRTTFTRPNDVLAYAAKDALNSPSARR